MTQAFTPTQNGYSSEVFQNQYIKNKDICGKLSTSIKTFVVTILKGIKAIFSSIMNLFRKCFSSRAPAQTQASTFFQVQPPTTAQAPTITHQGQYPRELTIIGNEQEVQRKLNQETQISAQNYIVEEDHPEFVITQETLTPTQSGSKIVRSHLGSTFNVGFSHAQGRRPTMEDEHQCGYFEINSCGMNIPITFFGVFDGHGGQVAARYTKNHIQRLLQNTLQEFCRYEYSDKNIWNALKHAFVHLDQEFKQNNPQDSSGTTATVSLIMPDRTDSKSIWTVNVGDSRTIINANDPNPNINLSSDQKPNIPRFFSPVQNRGGFVENWGEAFRVDGILAMARALGDKITIDGLLGNHISSRPKITKIPYIPGRLILCCDGVYDVSCSRQIVALVQSFRDQAPDQIARTIVNSAYGSGSTDNISAMIVDLR